jgi:hypothetical protein
MVANIQLLQGQVIRDPDTKKQNVSQLIHELTLEILSDEEMAIAAAPAPMTEISSPLPETR